jgi:hypothetical protein
MRWVEWVEPFGPNSEPVYCRVTEATAIAHAKEVGKRAKYEYKDDQHALDDFITVHWASVKEENEKPDPVLNPFGMLMRAVNGALTPEDYDYVQSVVPKPLLAGAAESNDRPAELVSDSERERT